MKAPTCLKIEPGPVATVRLNRPEVRNALDDAALRELAAAFKAFGRDPALRAVVVRGEGSDFCAGADIEWMRRGGRLKGAAARRDARLLADMCESVSSCPVPVIARVQGAVFGGGIGLIACCDIVAAEDLARMSFSECRLGILPAVISPFVLPKIGPAAARRYYLTGEVFGMVEARALGLVHEIVPASGLDEKVAAIAAQVLRCGPRAVREAKSFIGRVWDAPPARRVELALKTLIRVRSSPEGQEGLGAFMERRPAPWVAEPARPKP